MTIGKRILSGYVVILTLLILVCGSGIAALSQLRSAYAEFINHDAKIILAVLTLRISVEQQSAAFRGYVIYQDPAMFNSWQEAGKDFESVSSRLRTALNDTTEIASLDAIEEANREWRGRQRERLYYAGKGAEGTLDELDDQRASARELIMSKMDSFVDHRNLLLEEARRELERKLNQVILAMIAFAGLALCTGIGISLWTTGSIGRALRSAIGQLASSTAEISAMTRQVASSATETAAAVSQTTSTVEEVKQTANVSVQKAKLVSQNAQRSVEISESGRKAVDLSMDGMEGIRAQMEIIAQSVVRLSEQGQSIGEIIATVNDLAEQSNLLAVNASIEAARAGEYGKGFSVVAQEVKNLADQSKQATAQVRNILGEVQRATGAAVMAAEQGNKAVEAGVIQTTAAGAAIQELSTNIAESAQSAAQIAASSQQQLAGMDQVSLAMDNISQASRQNVAGTSQSESAAEALSGLARQLRALIEKPSTPGLK